jgi:hypothetical protein
LAHRVVEVAGYNPMGGTKRRQEKNPGDRWGAGARQGFPYQDGDATKAPTLRNRLTEHPLRGLSRRGNKL